MTPEAFAAINTSIEALERAFAEEAVRSTRHIADPGERAMVAQARTLEWTEPLLALRTRVLGWQWPTFVVMVGLGGDAHIVSVC